MAMTKDERQITNQLAERLADKGFKRKNIFIARPWGDGEARILCSVRTRVRKKLVTLMLSVRFEGIERIFRRADDVAGPTIGLQIGNLYKKKDYKEWDLGQPGTLTLLENEIEVYAVPFFEAHSKIDDLISKLQSNDRNDWIWVCNPGRLGLLAAFLLFKGRRAEALFLLEQEAARLRSINSPNPGVEEEAKRLLGIREQLSKVPESEILQPATDFQAESKSVIEKASPSPGR